MNTTAMDNTTLDRLVVRADRRTNYTGFPYQRFEDMHGAVAKRHIIKGIFARGETSAWIAPPGGMKSALMASAAIAIASGADWFGKRNKETCAVVYFALERADLVRRRIEAHSARMGLQGLPIALVSTTFNLMKVETVPRVVATIREVEAEYGVSVGLVIFDTFAKLIAAGGGDEDKAKDQGAVFANVQRVKNETDVHVALVGHTGKDETRGSRGSNAILGDVDLMVTISGDTIKTATVTKANDAPEGPLFAFKSEVHEFGRDEDGDPITVNIVSSDDAAPEASSKTSEPRLNANQKTFYRFLHDAGATGLTLEEWNQKAREVGIGIARKATLHDLRTALVDKGMVRQSGDRWIVRHS
jgi:hypothetical protein